MTQPPVSASAGDVQIAARHADPRTTTRYERARNNLDRHASYIVTTASPAPRRARPKPTSITRTGRNLYRINVTVAFVIPRAPQLLTKDPLKRGAHRRWDHALAVNVELDNVERTFGSAT